MYTPTVIVNESGGVCRDTRLQVEFNTLKTNEEKIIEAAIECFVRFGVRKSSMNDIASKAGVSRQTVYDLFDGKDALIRASIRSTTERNLAQVRARLAQCETLMARLDVYFEETVVKSFLLLQTAGEPEDLISGHNEAGKAEIDLSHRRHEALVAEFLAPHAQALEAAGETTESLAHYVVAVIMGFKYQATDLNDLKALLNVLKSTIAAIAGAGETP